MASNFLVIMSDEHHSRAMVVRGIRLWKRPIWMRWQRVGCGSLMPTRHRRSACQNA